LFAAVRASFDPDVLPKDLAQVYCEFKVTARAKAPAHRHLQGSVGVVATAGLVINLANGLLTVEDPETCENSRIVLTAMT
jgi:hypothetical protein